MPHSAQRFLRDIARLFESGALKPPIVAAKYSLSDAAQAYQRVASGESGKAMLIKFGKTSTRGEGDAERGAATCLRTKAG